MVYIVISFHIISYLGNLSNYAEILFLQLSETSGTAVTLKIGRREVPGSNPGQACRPSCSEFSVIFSETRLNTG